MLIKSATFVTSAVKPSQYPPAELPEFAFSGRSNVGKSSLINKIVNRKRLVKTSRTPGRTQLINFFDFNEAFTFVDLPGYGYAKVPQAVRKTWGPMIETYITGRATLKAIVMIMDLRRTPGLEEQNLTGWLGGLDIPIIRVLTKADKLSKTKRKTQLALNANALSLDPTAFILFSAKSGMGKEVVWEAIERRLI